MKKQRLEDIARNSSMLDLWSLTHILWGILLTLLVGPLYAFLALLLWEPLEVLILSKLLFKRYHTVFGHEALRNSLSDIAMNSIGIAIAYFFLL